jgi:hypothetical protein
VARRAAARRSSRSSERKRPRECVTESFLVRVSAFVRPSAVMTLVSWGRSGSRSSRTAPRTAATSRACVNDDWAIVRAPDTLTRACRPARPRASVLDLETGRGPWARSAVPASTWRTPRSRRRRRPRP